MRSLLNIEKVKEKARKLELKGQIDKAITQYAKILEELEGSPELTDELALYNKLGDLYLKRGDVASAVEQYEAAVTHYAEQGFPNNAIALCNKVLRNAPGRTHIYLKLAKLMMQRGFVAEAKQNLLEYAERMQKNGQIEDAFHALKEFADLSPDNEEIRLLLAEQLKNAARTEEAREQLAKLYHEVKESGDARRARKTLERMKAIDPDYQVEGAPAPQLKSRKEKSSDIVFIDLDDDKQVDVAAAEEPEVSTAVDEPLVVEPTSIGEQAEVLDGAAVDDSLEVQHSAAELDIGADGAAVEPLEGLDPGGRDDSAGDTGVEALDIETTVLDDSLATEEEVDRTELPLVDTPADAEVGDGDIGELNGLVAEGETPSDMFAVESESGEPTVEIVELEDESDLEGIAEEGAGVGELEIEPLDDVTDDSGSQRHGADVAEAGVEVPDLDVDGFVAVPAFEGLTEEEEDAEPLADLPMLDMDDESDDEKSEVGAIPDLDVSEAAEDTMVELEQSDDDSSDQDVEPVAEHELKDEDEDAESAAVGIAEEDESEYLTEYELEDTEDEEETATAVAPDEGSVGAAPDISELESRVLDDPAAPEPHRELAEALIESGERERGLEELEIALSAYEGLSDWQHAQAVSDEILRLEPNSVHHHQKRVEYAYRMDDRQALASAYLELADALVRGGEVQRAQVVYQRVLEHDPESDRARVALDTLQPRVEDEPEEPAKTEGAAEDSQPAGVAESDTAERRASGFVDLGALVMEEEQARDTRMRIQHDEPTGDEERDFQITLSEFKKGIDANIDLEDSQAHYDLGVAFREMGLLDEAISEFQKALRGSQGRLRTAEALGLCFFDKGQYAVASTVLKRAVDAESGGDDDKIGLLYWLGRCEEEQGHGNQALSYYQRIFSIDIDFQDVRKRVKQLAQADS